MLKQDIDKAEEQLKAESTEYLGLRDYQLAAIRAVESAIEKGERTCLVAMATGTGRPEPASAFQGMVKRILFPSDENDVPPVDQYDCVVVDECHRGYLLDREMGDTEFQFRDENDYISKYRRVLDHFDAVKVGLTATPALHTTEIFGRPVFQYSYREAVIDGTLIDYEPPIQIVTKLAEDGMHWKAGEQMAVYNAEAQTLDTVVLRTKWTSTSRLQPSRRPKRLWNPATSSATTAQPST